MKRGTKSLLFGVHHWLLHPVSVWLAWRQYYGRPPSWRETICIIVHDWGYWGCESMEGDGQMHPVTGANIASRLLGEDWELLVLYHSRNFAQHCGATPSALCWPDKLHITIYPDWLYLLLGHLSGEIAEYKAMTIAQGGVPADATDAEWHRWAKQYIARVVQEQDCYYPFSAVGP
jgi:hypothetical protein